MTSAAYHPSHVLTWTPDDGDEPVHWLVLVVMHPDMPQSWVAVTEKDWKGGQLSDWSYDAKTLLWYWRGRPGFQGRDGKVSLRRLTIEQVQP